MRGIALRIVIHSSLHSHRTLVVEIQSKFVGRHRASRPYLSAKLSHRRVRGPTFYHLQVVPPVVQHTTIYPKLLRKLGDVLALLHALHRHELERAGILVHTLLRAHSQPLSPAGCCNQVCLILGGQAMVRVKAFRDNFPRDIVTKLPILIQSTSLSRLNARVRDE